MAKAKGGGGKLNKSETVQVRFDPILKMAAELAAAGERRTLSNFTEIAVEKAVKLCVVARDEAGNPIDAWRVARECWDAEPLMRIRMLALYYPDLLTIREQKIVEAKRFAKHFVDGLGKIAELALMTLEMRCWDDFCRYADDQISLDEVITGLRNARAFMDKDGTITDADPDLSKKESP